MSPGRSPLVLLHGYTDTPRTWDPLIPLLQEHHDVHAPATLGHAGGKLPSPMPDPLEAMIRQVEADMDAAGIETAHLVGNSHGGWLALELAARGRAKSVVALSPGGGWIDDKAKAKVIKLFKRTRRATEAGAPYFELIAKRPKLRKLALRDVVAHGDRIPASTALALLRGGLECEMFEPWAEAVQHGTGYPTELAKIDVPVRIAWGTEDRVLPKEACSPAFHALVPGAEWIDLPGAGHLPHHDEPKMVARIILEVTTAPAEHEPAGAEAFAATA
jgi:pimeloyl-ACP methyl ester carboxylesterase